MANDNAMTVAPAGSPDEEAQDHFDRVITAWERERPDLDFSPWAVTRRIDWLAQRMHDVEPLYRSFGLNRAGVEVLTHLRQAGPPYRLSPTALWRRTMVASATMTNRLDRLERAGLVRRLPDPTDRRALVVELTTEGAELIDRTLAAIMARRAEQLVGLDAEEQRLLAALLRKLIVALGDDVPERPELLRALSPATSPAP